MWGVWSVRIVLIVLKRIILFGIHHVKTVFEAAFTHSTNPSHANQNHSPFLPTPQTSHAQTAIPANSGHLDHLIALHVQAVIFQMWVR